MMKLTPNQRRVLTYVGIVIYMLIMISFFFDAIGLYDIGIADR